MSSRLIRFILAICVAFVFSGQVEASARHCVQAAIAMDAAAQDETAGEAPCHETAKPGDAGAHGHASAPEPAKPAPASSPCECAAMLKTSALPDVERASVAIEHLDWIPPVAAVFASADREADLRPPRA